MRYLFGFAGKETVTGKMVLATMLAVLGTLPQSASAQAQSDSVLVSSGQLELAQPSELESRLADLEAAYQEANVKKPRAGVAVSVFVMTAGTIMVVAGAVINSDFGSGGQGSDPAGTALIATGSITIAAGVGGLAFSGVRLKRAKRKRQQLEPEIASLRSALDSGTK